MRASGQANVVYQQLADAFDHDGQAPMRDRFLVLAADAALAAGLRDEAERLRHRLLERNPHHLLRPFASFAEALRSTDVKDYLADLRTKYPPVAAERLLGSLRPPPSAPADNPTAPASALHKDEEADALRKPAAAPFKVYSMQESEDERTQKAPARPIPTARPVQAPKAAPMARSRETYALQPEAAARTTPGPRPPREDENEAGNSAWICTGLFLLVLAAGAALTAYTFVRPFLPAEWWK